MLQVGHIERFNPAMVALAKLNLTPKFLMPCESVPPFRSLDVGVVLDVMIHDIDIILSLVKCRCNRSVPSAPASSAALRMSATRG